MKQNEVYLNRQQWKLPPLWSQLGAPTPDVVDRKSGWPLPWPYWGASAGKERPVGDEALDAEGLSGAAVESHNDSLAIAFFRARHSLSKSSLVFWKLSVTSSALNSLMSSSEVKPSSAKACTVLSDSPSLDAQDCTSSAADIKHCILCILLIKSHTKDGAKVTHYWMKIIVVEYEWVEKHKSAFSIFRLCSWK